MRDEFPEQEPDEATRLHCLQGTKKVTLHCINLAEDDEDIAFPEVATNLVASTFLRTQREKFEAARLRALTGRHGNRGKKRTAEVKGSRKALRAKVKRKLVRKKAKQSMKDFLAELRARSAEGYSARQLIASHMPAIGSEEKVAGPEVTAELAKREVVNSGGATKLTTSYYNSIIQRSNKGLTWDFPGENIIFLLTCRHYCPADPTKGDPLCEPFFCFVVS